MVKRILKLTLLSTAFISMPQISEAKRIAPAPQTALDYELILNEFEGYLDCVYTCIQRFTNPKNALKLAHYADEIDTCVKHLDNNVLTPLHAHRATPLANHIYNVAYTLKKNQVAFKKLLTGGYSNFMSLGLALQSLAGKAYTEVTKSLQSSGVALEHSELKALFAPIKAKIIALTNHNPKGAMSALQQRF